MRARHAAFNAGRSGSQFIDRLHIFRRDTVAMPVAESLAQKGLSLPCSVGLAESEQDRVIAALRKIASGVGPGVTACHETSIS